MKITDIKTIFVAGGGLMSTRIALTGALHDYQMVVYDTSEQSLKNWDPLFKSITDNLILEKKLTREATDKARKNIRLVTDKAEARKAQMLIETVYEDLELKRQVFAEYDTICPEEVIFATNTSNLLPRDIETLLSSKRRERFAAYHFNAFKSIIDIMGGSSTSEDTMQLLHELALSMGELPIMMKKEKAGYLQNSLITPWLTAALSLAASGYGSIYDIDRSWMTVQNMWCGPFGMADICSLDLLLRGYTAAAEAGDPVAAEIAKFLKPYVDRGDLGPKSGKGFYTWPNCEFMASGFLKGEDPV